MKVIVLGYGGRADVVKEVERFLPIIERYAEILLVDLSGEKDLSPYQADYVIVFGGDGSILRAARQMGKKQFPVIAVNLGKLGFLADISPQELEGVLSLAEHSRLPVVDHLMLSSELVAQGSVLVQSLALNEVAILNGPPFGLLDVELWVDGDLATVYSGDGLILATPVGSTAHSLSAGGPILRKDLDAIVICPISPHTLSNRPVVDSADRVYELRVLNPQPNTALVIDGCTVGHVRADHRIYVRRADPRFQLVSAPGHSYYRTLREKLGWGGQTRANNRSTSSS